MAAKAFSRSPIPDDLGPLTLVSFQEKLQLELVHDFAAASADVFRTGRILSAVKGASWLTAASQRIAMPLKVTWSTEQVSAVSQAGS